MTSTIRPLLRRAALLAGAGMLAGCAASVQRGSNEARIDVPPASARKVVLAVSGKPEFAQQAGWGYLVEEWQNSMQWAANNAGIAYAWQAPAARAATEPATLVHVKVKDFRFVSTAKRWVTGIFSGNAFIDAEASFTDLATGRNLGTRSFQSSSSVMQGVFSAMTERQLEVISTEIVRDVTQR